MTYNHVVDSILRAFSDDDGYDILAELDEDVYRIIDCPVCGKKTLDMYWICSECDWEYDIFIDYDDDEEFSDANGATLGEYKNAYRILREGVNKLQSKELERIYLINCSTNFEYDLQPFEKIIDHDRIYGFFEDFESCKQALNENRGDMYAKYYPLATVKIIDLDSENKPRISNVEKWFVWDAERRGFFETDEEIDYSQGWCKSPSVPLISSAEIYKNEENNKNSGSGKRSRSIY